MAAPRKYTTSHHHVRSALTVGPVQPDRLCHARPNRIAAPGLRPDAIGDDDRGADRTGRRQPVGAEPLHSVADLGGHDRGDHLAADDQSRSLAVGPPRTGGHRHDTGPAAAVFLCASSEIPQKI